MANSIRDTLGGTQGYQIGYRPSLIPLPERDPGQLPYLTSASARSNIR